MTNKYDYSKIRKARNEYEALLKIHGVSNRRMSKIMQISEFTGRRYIIKPYLIRALHIYRLAVYIGIPMIDVAETIEYDIKEII